VTYLIIAPYEYRLQVLSTECDRRNIMITPIDRCIDNTCYDAKLEQQSGQLFITSTIFFSQRK